MLESTVYIKIDKIIKEYRNWSKHKECRNPDPQLSYICLSSHWEDQAYSKAKVWKLMGHTMHDALNNKLKYNY